MSDYPDYDDDWCCEEPEEDSWEPVGSCEECCVNLYEDDDPESCD